MGINELKVTVCRNPSEAPNYNTDGRGIKAATLDEAIVVNNGTNGGNATIDLIFTDPKGNRYVAMITGRLLKTVTDLCQGRG